MTLGLCCSWDLSQGIVSVDNVLCHVAPSAGVSLFTACALLKFHPVLPALFCS